MTPTRRTALVAFFALQVQQSPEERPAIPGHEKDEEDVRLPNGKSQKDAISKKAHEDALKEVDSLIQLAEDLRDELKRSGEYVVAVSSLKKTEEIEKLARRIHGQLKA